MQLVALAATNDGSERGVRLTAGDIYWERNQWFTPGTEYDSVECRGGGVLDLGFGSIWS